VELGAAALDALMAFDWPGNVRQLERVLERAIALGPGSVVDVGDLPSIVTKGYRDLVDDLPGDIESLRTWSSRYVRGVLDRCDGNKRKACDVLDISYHTLRSHLSFAPGATQGDARTP